MAVTQSLWPPEGTRVFELVSGYLTKFSLHPEFEEEESYTWTILKPADFNKETNLGWRYAKAELDKIKAAKKK